MTGEKARTCLSKKLTHIILSMPVHGCNENQCIICNVNLALIMLSQNTSYTKLHQLFKVAPLRTPGLSSINTEYCPDLTSHSLPTVLATPCTSIRYSHSFGHIINSLSLLSLCNSRYQKKTKRKQYPYLKKIMLNIL